MEQKNWEQRLDRAADRVAESVKEGVRALEGAYEKGKESLGGDARAPSSSDTGTPSEPARSKKGSVRLGLVLVALGIVWLLRSLGILDEPVFPILLIILGVYFIARSR
jgi:hypothetical protein